MRHLPFQYGRAGHLRMKRLHWSPTTRRSGAAMMVEPNFGSSKKAAQLRWNISWLKKRLLTTTQGRSMRQWRPVVGGWLEQRSIAMKAALEAVLVSALIK